MISPSRIYAAISVCGGGDKSLDSIPHNLVNQDDVAIVADGTNVYFYVLDADSGLDESVPYVIKPDDIESAQNPSSVHKRWHLVSTKYFADNILQSHGKYIQTGQIKAFESEELKFISGDGTTIIINPDGSVSFNDITVTGQITVDDVRHPPFIINSDLVVDHLNADKLDGYHANRFILADGSTPFTNPVSGIDPIDDANLTTKSWTEEYVLQIADTIYTYVDDAIAAIEIVADLTDLENQVNAHISPSSDDHLLYARLDGSRNFTGAIGGILPSLPEHFVTKQYVDDRFVTTHSELSGLNGDDHLQYSLVDGSRGFTSTVEGITPVSDFHLSTKEYVDERIANIFHTKKLQIHTFDHDTTEWIINHNFGDKHVVVDFYEKFTNKQISPDRLVLTNNNTAIAYFAVDVQGYAVVNGIVEHFNKTLSQTWTVEHTFGSKEVIFNIFDTTDEEIFPLTTTIIDDTHIEFTFFEPVDGYVVLSNDIVVFQFASSTEWYVNHTYNNKNLLANIFDSGDIEIIPENIEATDDNTLLITFEEPESGYVVISGSEAVILDPGLFIINHNHLRNLDHDDHLHYANLNGVRGFTNTIAGITPLLDDHLTTKKYVDDEIDAALNIGIVLRHDELLNLDADDHLQYSLVDGTRDFTGPINGVTPTQTYHLATKQYVDSMVNSTVVLQQGKASLINGADNITITLSNALSTDYAVVVSLENTIDGSPSIYGYIIRAKSDNDFAVYFSGNIDSANYKLNWIVTPI